MVYRMREPLDIETANLSYYCRSCKQKVRGQPITSPQFRSTAYDNHAWLICRCPTNACKLSFIIYDRINDRVTKVYPLPDFDPDNYLKCINKKVREDIAEGERCLHANSYKGAVTMYRRAIQNMILDKIKEPGLKNKKLYQQIDRLFEKGFITRHLKETAHEIRHFGNFGAHPQDDLLDNTTYEDAQAIEQLTFDLIQTIYVTPYKTSQMKQKRISKKKSKK